MVAIALILLIIHINFWNVELKNNNSQRYDEIDQYRGQNNEK